jgi:uncharacterized protein DUF4440
MTTRFRTYLGLSIWLLMCSISSSQTLAKTDARDAIVHLEKMWLNVEGGADAVKSIFADDFVHVLPIGFITKDEQLQYLRTHSTAKGETKDFQDLRVRVFGTAAVATGIVVITTGDGKIHKTIFTDVFAYRDGKWQAVNAQENPLAEPSAP